MDANGQLSGRAEQVQPWKLGSHLGSRFRFRKSEIPDRNIRNRFPDSEELSRLRPSAGFEPRVGAKTLFRVPRLFRTKRFDLFRT